MIEKESGGRVPEQAPGPDVRAPLEPPADAAWLQGSGGLRLYTATRLPCGEVRSVIYLVLGPEIGSAAPYPQFTAAACAAGFAVFVLHPRGTGYSDGSRGDIDDYSLLVDDLALGLTTISERLARPVFLLAHSVGAALALELAARSRAPLAGLILVNPAYRLKSAKGMGPSAADYVRFAFNYLFRRTALTVDMNARPEAVVDPSDRAEAEAMRADPLVVRYFSMRFLAGQRSVMRRCVANAALTTAPLLLVQGARDALVDPSGNDEILAAAGTADKARLIAPEGGHGSSAVQTVVAALLEWIEAR